MNNVWMKLFALAATILVGASVQVNAATPTVESGVVTGATGVDVNGLFFDVTFNVACTQANSSGCLEGAFDFAGDSATALLAAQTLGDQVFLDFAEGPQLASNPNLALGCCRYVIPYDVRPDGKGDFLDFAEYDANTNAAQLRSSREPLVGSSFNLVQFSEAAVTAAPAPVPLVLLLTAVIGLFGARRLTARQAC